MIIMMLEESFPRRPANGGSGLRPAQRLKLGVVLLVDLPVELELFVGT